jgi:4-amino-4-deoxy-L-arabinose transferase-like glycosyltransferase
VYPVGLVSARRFVLALTLIAAVGFVGRAVYVLAVTNTQNATYDELYYRTEAATIAAGEGFELPDVYGFRNLGEGEHPPLTALLLTPAAVLTDNNDVAMRLTVAFAGAGVVVLIGLIAREIAGRRAGLFAAGVAAVYPNLWVTDGLLLPETFATLATAAAVLCAYLLIRQPTWLKAAALGAACALAMLTRGELMLLVLLLALPVVLTISGLTFVRRLKLAVVVAVAAALVIAPWQAYMVSQFEKPMFLSYGDAGVVAGANCDPTYSGPLIGFWVGLCKRYGELPGDPSVEADRKRRMGRQYMGDNLERLPLVIPARVGRTWGAYRPFQMAKFAEAEGRPRWISLTGWGIYWVLMGFAIAGVVILRRRRVALIPLVAAAVIVTIVGAVFYGLVRFRAPAEVSIVVLAAVALDAAWARRFSPA